MNGAGKQVVVATALGSVGSRGGAGSCLVGMTCPSVVRRMFLGLTEWVAQHREWTQCYIIHFKMADVGRLGGSIG